MPRSNPPIAHRTDSERLSRRDWLRFGTTTLGGLTLPHVLRLRAATAAERAATPPETAVIFVMLGGGASHFETYDPKPAAPAAYRGSLQPVQTRVPGVQVCELLPQQAQLMHELAIIRSIHHHEASHIALHMVESGYFLRDSRNIRRGEMPSVGSIISRSLGNRHGMPAFISLPRAQAYSGPVYLGGACDAFNVDADPNQPAFQINNLSLTRDMTMVRLHDRCALLRSFDQAQRLLDLEGSSEALDVFQRQALQLLTGEQARIAFDLEREDGRVRDGYGRTAFGQRLLLARRLVEAGVPFVMVRTFDWDDHANLEQNMRQRMPSFDTGLAALIRDLRERGLQRQVLIVAMGEFGRTPRINPNAGRDHWPGVMSVLLSGGAYRMGQVIGASDSRGGTVAHTPYRPQSVLAMLYYHLGIDPAQTFPDFSGRPRHILEVRELIRELL